MPCSIRDIDSSAVAPNSSLQLTYQDFSISNYNEQRKMRHEIHADLFDGAFSISSDDSTIVRNNNRRLRSQFWSQLISQKVIRTNQTEITKPIKEYESKAYREYIRTEESLSSNDHCQHWRLQNVAELALTKRSRRLREEHSVKSIIAPNFSKKNKKNQPICECNRCR